MNNIIHIIYYMINIIYIINNVMCWEWDIYDHFTWV